MRLKELCRALRRSNAPQVSGQRTRAIAPFCVAIAYLLGSATGKAEDGAAVNKNPGIKILKDIPYAGDRDPRHLLDLYLPEIPLPGKLPLVILVHGGGWNAGEKEAFEGPAAEFVRHGYASASLNYRLSRQAKFPAQVEDCKAAVRWLRAHADTYGLDPQKFVIGGHSAGGHLAAFLGVTNGEKRFERGKNLKVDSSVQAVLWFAGVGNFVARVQTPGYESEGAPGSGQSMLIGGAVLKNREKAMKASPIRYVGEGDAPIIFFHGDRDELVPIAQAKEMDEALKAKGVETELHIMPGANHGGPGFFSPLAMHQIDKFLSRVLKPESGSIGVPPLAPGQYTLTPISAPKLVLEARRPVAKEQPAIGLAAPGGTSNQAWTFTQRGDGFFSIHPSDQPSQILTVVEEQPKNGTRVELIPDKKVDSQSWLVTRDVIASTYVLIPVSAPNFALDDFAGNSTPQAVIDLWGYNPGDTHMRWTIEPATAAKPSPTSPTP